MLPVLRCWEYYQSAVYKAIHKEEGGSLRFPRMSSPAAVMTLPVRASPHLHARQPVSQKLFVQTNDCFGGWLDAVCMLLLLLHILLLLLLLILSDDVGNTQHQEWDCWTTLAHKMASRSETPLRRYSTTLLRRKMW